MFEAWKVRLPPDLVPPDAAMPFLALAIMKAIEMMKDTGETDAAEISLSSLFSIIEDRIIRPAVKCDACRKVHEDVGHDPIITLAIELVISHYFSDRGNFEKSASWMQQKFREKYPNLSHVRLESEATRVAGAIAADLTDIMKT